MHTRDTSNTSFVPPVAKTSDVKTRTFQVTESQEKVGEASLDVTEADVQTRLAHAGRFGHDLTNSSGQQVQTKLKLGQPGDIYEQEADAMAQRVMAIREDEVGEEAASVKGKGGQVSPKLQAKGTGLGMPVGFEQQLATKRGGGSPLSKEVRAFMEPRFGVNFSEVTIHQEPELTSSIQAQAFTHGQNIYFNSGKYAPGTDRGKELLAHELTHVVQQTTNGVCRKPMPGLVQKDDQEDSDSNNSFKTEPNQKAGFKGQVVKESKTKKHKIDLTWSFTKKGKSWVRRENADEPSRKNDPHDMKIDGGVIKTEAYIKQQGGRISSELIARLINIEAGVSPFPSYPGFRFEGDFSAFKGKKSDSITDLNLIEVSFGLAGSLPASWLKEIGIPESVISEFSITIKGKYTYKVPPKDLANLRRMNEAQKILDGNIQKLKQKREKVSSLRRQKLTLKRQAKKAHAKRKKSLAKKIKKIDKQVNRLEKNLRKHKAIIKKASEQYADASQKLETRIGKRIGKMLTKATGRRLASLVSKLVPGLNLISSAHDIFELGTALYGLAIGETEFNLDGEAHDDSTEDLVNDDNNRNLSREDQSLGKSSDHSSSEKEEIVEADLYDDVQDPYDEKIKLHANSQSFLSAVQGDKIALTSTHLREINEIIPSDMTVEDLQKLIRKFADKGVISPDQMADEFIGKLIHSVQDIEADRKKSDSDISIDYKRAAWVNRYEKKMLGWTTSLLSQKRHVSADSPEFVDEIAAYQKKKGIKQDGILGPLTTLTRLQEIQMEESPIFHKATKSLNYRLKKGRKNSQRDTGLDRQSKNNEISHTNESNDSNSTKKPKGVNQEELVKESKDRMDSPINNDKEDVFSRFLPVNSEMRKLLILDAETGKLVPNNSFIKKLMLIRRSWNGLEVAYSDVRVNIRDIPSSTASSNLLQIVSVDFDCRVTQLSPNSDQNYPYKEGYTRTVNDTFWYDPKVGHYGDVQTSTLEQDISDSLAYHKKKGVLRPAETQSRNLGNVVWAKVNQVVSQSAPYIDGDKTFIEVEVEIIPTKLIEGSKGFLYNGKHHTFVIGQPIKISINYFPKM
ncbi:MAG: DUF4157 domain-containing protein [Cyanobacteria bacterium J06560_6]